MKQTELRITSPRSNQGIGLSICPGKVDPFAYSGPCARDLRDDVKAIKDWGADIVVTLMEQWELERLQVSGLGEAVRANGMDWHFWQVIDGSPLTLADRPDADDAWQKECRLLRKALDDGKKIFIHCRGGLGRTGTLAARLLIENGLDPETAIREVREARKGAIETSAQERYLREKKWQA